MYSWAVPRKMKHEWLPVTWATSHSQFLLPLRDARWYIFRPKIPILAFCVRLEMENVGIFYVHLVYFTAIWIILRTFGTFCGYLVHSPRFLVRCTN
jgi:hypothetical protein